jgi:hypothetical protein
VSANGIKPNLRQLEVTARLFGSVFFRAVGKLRRHLAMACTPVMVRGMSSGDRTSMKMATALTLDMLHSHFCATGTVGIGMGVRDSA